MNIKAITDLARLKASTIVGFTVILGMVAIIKSIPSFNMIIFGFGVGFVLSSSTNTINDIMDLEIDKIEKPNRPIPRGAITLKLGWYIYVIESILAIFLAFILSLQSFLLTILVAIISFLYSLKLKNVVYFKNTLTAFGIASAFLVGTLSTCQNISISIFLFFFLIFDAVVAFEIHKDIADVEGDSKLGKNTVATTIGTRKAAALAITLYFIGFLLFQGILFTSESEFIIILWIIDLLGICGIFYILIPLWKNQDIDNIHQTRKRTMALFSVLIIAVIINFVI